MGYRVSPGEKGNRKQKEIIMMKYCWCVNDVNIITVINNIEAMINIRI